MAKRNRSKRYKRRSFEEPLIEKPKRTISEKLEEIHAFIILGQLSLAKFNLLYLIKEFKEREKENE